VPSFEPQDPDFEAKVRASFERQRVMSLIGAELVRVEPGLTEIALAWRAELTQQHGFLHAGISTTIADSAGGYAAFSLMPPGSSILSIEYKVNLLAPAKGERFLAVGRVVRAGRKVTTCELEVLALQGESRKTCLVGLQTTLCLPATPDLPSG
jgi:uncharacterized protein (TIGR00369 family)